MRLILASQSPYRLQLLRDAGFEVQAVPAGVSEPDLSQFASLEAGLMHTAQLKAQRVASRGVHGLILAADTVGHVAGAIFGKPADRHEARRMLQAISGTAHSVLTGWCLWRTRDQLCLCGTEVTQIVMRTWTASELEQYLDSGDWQDKCGAYGLQLPADPFVTEIRGSTSNVIGLPLERLQSIFAEFPQLLQDTA